MDGLSSRASKSCKIGEYQALSSTTTNYKHRTIFHQTHCNKYHIKVTYFTNRVLSLTSPAIPIHNSTSSLRCALKVCTCVSSDIHAQIQTNGFAHCNSSDSCYLHTMPFPYFLINRVMALI